MSLPVDPPADPPTDPFDDEDRPLWSDSETPNPGPRDSLIDSDEERGQAARMAALQERARRRAARGQAAAPAGPLLNPEDARSATSLAADLARETRGRGRFSAFPDGGSPRRLLYLFGIGSTL